MARALTLEDVTAELGTVTSASDARAVVSRASRIAGAPDNRPLEVQELLRVCQALAAEGGMIQQIAELIATRTLRE